MGRIESSSKGDVSIPLVWAKCVVQMWSDVCCARSLLFFFFPLLLFGVLGGRYTKFNGQIKGRGKAVQAMVEGASSCCCCCVFAWAELVYNRSGGSFLIIQTKCSLTGHDKRCKKKKNVVGSQRSPALASQMDCKGFPEKKKKKKRKEKKRKTQRREMGRKKNSWSG